MCFSIYLLEYFCHLPTLTRERIVIIPVKKKMYSWTLSCHMEWALVCHHIFSVRCYLSSVSPSTWGSTFLSALKSQYHLMGKVHNNPFRARPSGVVQGIQKKIRVIYMNMYIFISLCPLNLTFFLLWQWKNCTQTSRKAFSLFLTPPTLFFS